jgi:adenylate cyclase
MAPLIVPPHLREQHAAGLSRYLTTGEARLIGRLIEIDALRGDGSIVPVELTLSEVRAEGEHLFTAFLRDTTERRRFQERLKEAERKRDNLARYFSPKVVDRLMGQEGPLSSVKLPHVTVLFADMMGFGAISRFAPGEEMLRLLREFHALIEQAVFVHEGSLDKYMGDGLMATFGTPEPGPRDATNAVACARAMATSVVAWSRRRRDLGLPAIHIGIGLHHGEVTLGDIGSDRHPEFTVVGDTVNLASRIEELTREHAIGILASEEVVRAVRAEGGETVLEGFRELGPLDIRGRDETVRLWGRTADDLRSPRSG